MPNQDAGFDPASPIYLQIIEDLLGRAIRGEFAPGDKLPSAKELAARTVVNVNTVVRAYQELERRGLVVTQRGRGTFLTTDEAKITDARNRLGTEAAGPLVQRLRALGFTEDEIHELIDSLLERTTDPAAWQP